MSNSAVTPPRIPAAVQFGVLLLTMLALLCHTVDSIWASSSDVAHHYALVARLSQLWVLPPGVDHSLGEMNIYPRGSHLMSALLGRLVHSAFLGMHLVTLLSMMTAWVALGALVLSLPKRAGLVALTILLVLLGMNYRWLHLNLFGAEDLAYFFFAQLVAQAMMVGALVLSLYLERHGVAAWQRHGLLIVCIYLITGTHLLPAAQLAGVTLAMIALDFVLPGRRGGRAWAGGALLAGATMLLVVLVLVTHPAFVAMRTISQNDGSLFPTFFDSARRIGAYCVLILALSAALTWRWARLAREQDRSRLLVMKYVGLFGLAAAGICLLQIVLLQLGQGSLYAVKKHIFSLNSICFVELALLPLLWPRQRATLALADTPARGDAGVFYSVLALPLLTTAAYCSLTERPAFLDTSDVVRLEHLLELRRDSSTPPQDGKYTYVIDVPGMPGNIAYMMSIGVFATPRTANSLDVLTQRMLTEPDLIGTIITGAGSTFGRMHDCLLPGSDGQLAMVDGRCAYRQLALGSDKIGFGTDDGQPNCVLNGFGSAEPGGRWTIGDSASLVCPLPKLGGAAPSHVVVSGGTLLSGSMTQRVRLRANDGPEHEFVFRGGQPAPALDLPLPPASDGKLHLQLNTPDAVTPRQLGLGPDDRKLGLIIKTLEFK